MPRLCAPTLTCVLMAVSTVAGADLAQLEKELGVHWMGVYFRGTKAGYAKMTAEKSSFRGAPTYRFSMDLLAHVTMLGTTQVVSAKEDRHFGHAGKLLALEASMSSRVHGMTMTSMSSQGVVQGDKMALTTQSAGAKRTRIIDAPTETLDDYLAANRLVSRGAKVGDSMTVHVFEGLMMQRPLTMELTVTAKKTIFFNGVETEVTEIEEFIKEMNMRAISCFDAAGEMLETQFGGMFVLRAESEAQAKDMAVAFDMVRTSIIRVAAPIARAGETKEMTAVVTGVTNPQIVLNTPRQQYEKVGPQQYRLVARSDDVSGLKPAAIPVRDPALAEDLQATWLLQCDHPKMKAKAAEVVGASKDAWTAAQKIRAFVYTRVEKVGSAALSNALETLETMRGDCSEHTALFVGLCRAAGIPARPCTGLVYWPRGRGFGYHQWASVYVGKWIEVDPTFNQPVADATHIKLAEGDFAEAAKLISVIDTLKVQVVATK